MNKLYFFINNFLGALRDLPGSMSVKKLIAILVALVYAISSLRFTNSENLAVVLGVHAGLITALIITHAVYKTKNPTDPAVTKPAEDAAPN